VPLDVVNLIGVSISSITSDDHHTCGVTQTGVVKCWGLGSTGQLGNRSTSVVRGAVDVLGLTGSLLAKPALATTSATSCVITPDNRVQCWGDNDSGQLGFGTFGGVALVAGTVNGLPSAVGGLAGSYKHFCALMQTGAVKCWGLNQYGQLGNNSTDRKSTPVDVVGVAGAVKVVAGYQHTCALLGGGTVKCWGRNDYGQLGNGTRSQSLVPLDVTGL
jgi:alpha-tubulin suppressor-like RCC1 family protein